MSQSTESRIKTSSAKITLDHIIRATSIFAGVDCIITPTISHILIGEYKTLHEYLGLPLHNNKTYIRFGGAYWGLTILYFIYLREKLVSKK